MNAGFIETFPDSLRLLLSLVLLLGLAALGLHLLKFMLFSSRESRGVDEYRLKSSLFSAAERSFLGVLELIDLGDLSVEAKVRLADVFDVRQGYARSRWQSAFNRISAKHVDFLLIQKTDGKPVLGIELDDRSHRETNRVERDKFVDHVFESAGLPLLRIKVQSTYNPRQIMTQIEETINRGSSRKDEG